MANKPVILLFHVAASKATQIESLCRAQGIKVYKIKPSSYNQQLGYLANITGFQRITTPYTGAEFPTEMMVMSGLNSDKLDAFLQEYKKMNITPIGVKGIITQYNITWTAEELFKELWKEHMQIILNSTHKY